MYHEAIDVPLTLWYYIRATILQLSDDGARALQQSYSDMDVRPMLTSVNQILWILISLLRFDHLRRSLSVALASNVRCHMLDVLNPYSITDM